MSLRGTIEALIFTLPSTPDKEFVMPIKTRTSVVIAVSALFLVGCGDSSEAGSGTESTAEASKGCTERDGAWFGRLEDGTGIISQTRKACEERLR
jgi:hypothetical protein